MVESYIDHLITLLPDCLHTLWYCVKSICLITIGLHIPFSGLYKCLFCHRLRTVFEKSAAAQAFLANDWTQSKNISYSNVLNSPVLL